MVLDMRDFKFDLDIVLRNCKRFEVAVEETSKGNSVTLSGEQFDIAEVIKDSFAELSAVCHTQLSGVQTIKKAKLDITSNRGTSGRDYSPSQISTMAA